MKKKLISWKIILGILISIEFFIVYKIYATSLIIENNREKRLFLENKVEILKNIKYTKERELNLLKEKIKLEEAKVLKKLKEKKEKLQKRYEKYGIREYKVGHRILDDEKYRPINIHKDFQNFFALIEVQEEDTYATLVKKVFNREDFLKLSKKEKEDIHFLAEKINRVGKNNLILGMNLVIPIELKALNYKPFAEVLSKEELEYIKEQRAKEVLKFWEEFESDWGNKYFQSRASKNWNHILKISLSKQYFALYKNGLLEYWGPVSTGKLGHETPTGFYISLWQKKDWFSYTYDVPMPNAVNFTTNGLFTHAGKLPGYPQSRGCPRMLESDSGRIYKVGLNEVFPIIVEE